MTWREDPRWAYLFVNLSTILWASNITLGRVLRDSVGPVSLTAARFIVAGIIFMFLLKDLVEQLRAMKRDWQLMFMMALTGVFGFPILLYLSLKYTTASHVALINGITPLMTIFLAGVFLREAITMNRIIGGFISLLGIAIVISNGSILIISQFNINIGDLIALLCAVIWGLYSVISRAATRNRSTLSATSISTWIAIPMLLPLTALEVHSNPPDIAISVVFAALYIGIFPTVIAFWSWNESIRRIGAGRAMAFYNMLPIYGTLFGIIFLKETPTWYFFIGGILVILGSLLAIRENIMEDKLREVRGIYGH